MSHATRPSASALISAALLLGATFTAGILVGKRPAAPVQGPGADLAITRASVIEALDPDADLRPEIERVIGAGRVQADSLMRTLLGEIRDISLQVEVEVRSLLTPAQNLRLDSLLSPSPARRPSG